MEETKLPTLPTDVEAERRILALLLNHPELIPYTCSVIKHDYFSCFPHRVVFGVINVLHLNAERVTSLTVAGMLMRAGALEKTGGFAFLAGLDKSLGDPDTLDEAIKHVAICAAKRMLIFSCSEVASACLQEGADLYKIMASDVAKPIVTAVETVMLHRMMNSKGDGKDSVN